MAQGILGMFFAARKPRRRATSISEDLGRVMREGFQRGLTAVAAEHIQPAHRLDTFCTCTRCSLAGHHLVAEGYEPTQPTQHKYLLGLSAPNETRGASPLVRDVTWWTARTCVFCGYTWKRYDAE